MEKDIDLTIVLCKVIKVYREMYGEMIFKFRRKNNDFIYTDIDPRLLKLIGLKREEFINKSPRGIFTRRETVDKLLDMYREAYEGTKVIYCILDPMKNVYVISLKRKMKNKAVEEVYGRCIIITADDKLLDMTKGVIVFDYSEFYG
ncbi:hypothetical protein EKA14_23985 [Bacillus mycoides]|uniref:hypothetical protein n=1 Tax=Bacillus hominis TaxID=2817478 RepID=UPI000FE386E7|nr:hypothetical protein [Bacillus hominis]RWS40192.1 hypothetical protein EKA14_23985 [Bacillus mycoides]